jgi:MoxR-like ATPase
VVLHDASENLALRELVRQVPVVKEVQGHTVELVLATHPDQPVASAMAKRYVRYGASPRGGQALLMAGKARALIQGRLCVSTQDIERVAAPALRHRLILNYEGEAAGIPPDEIVREALAAAGA